ncbi:MAG: hydroxyphenylacetyl-CoA thioesterase PaaI [Chitinophagia bacterium]|nr:hydroxyphenylacetyl-CoA thioesterase PaaI [Chitinophagia bacterium]
MDKGNKVLQAMLGNDQFSKWMGLVIDDYREGYCKLHFTIRNEMLNGFGIVHGGVVFSAADSAFAFVCNAQGVLTLALNVHINFVKSAKEGEVLTVIAHEVTDGNRIGIYEVTIRNEENAVVALFHGTGYRTGKPVVPPEQ